MAKNIDTKNLTLEFLKKLAMGGGVGVGMNQADNGAGINHNGVAPVEQPAPLNVEEVKTRIKSSGFRDSDDNVQKYLDNNIESNSTTEDFSGLKEDDDLDEVDSEPSYIESAIRSVPIFQVLSGLKKPLEVVTEGFKRYEGAKTLFLQSAIKGQLPDKAGMELLAGNQKTDFPDAKLRFSDHPELGDLFRSMGLPEGVSSTLGLGLDLVSDVPILGQIDEIVKGASKAGKAILKQNVGGQTIENLINPAKEATDKVGKYASEMRDKFLAYRNPTIDKTIADLQPIADEAGKVLAETAKTYGRKGKEAVVKGVTDIGEAMPDSVKQKFLDFRSSEMVKTMWSALRGEGRFDPLGPAMKQKIRQAVGEENAANFDAGTLQGLITSKIGKDEKLMFKMNDALRGDNTAFGALDKASQTYIKQGRDLIDNHSNYLVDELTQVYSKDPERFGKIAEKMGIKDGARIPLERLIPTIRENLGSYVKRSYLMFSDNSFKPSKDVFNNAIMGMVDDGFAVDVADATLKVQNILDTKIVNLVNPRNARFGMVKVDGDRFISRLKIPPYLRELMGEIKDPAYNLYTTTRDLAEARQHFKTIRGMDELGLFKETAEKGFNTQIKGGPLAFGLIDGKYTSKEVADVLNHTINFKNAMDKVIYDAMQALKFGKTVLNPKSQIHNGLSNIPFSFFAGTDPFSHPKVYSGIIDMWKDVAKVQSGKLPLDNPNYLKWKELIKNNIVGAELPNADKMVILDKFIHAPYNPNSVGNVAKKGLDGYIKFMSDMYGFTDQLFKASAYEIYQTRGMDSVSAVNEVYKWFPNYFEASRLAEHARNSQFGLLYLNPFTTFRTESHRIMLNAAKDSPTSKVMLGTLMGSRLAWNTAVLGMMGNSMHDIWEYMATRPEATSEVILNPRSKEFDLNAKYVDPFNTRGLFAPLLSLSGATGVSPFDYLLDFTTMSPDFGYSNLLTNALEPVLTGKGKYGEDLSLGDRAGEFAKAVGPTSFTVDLPKVLDNNQDEIERYRRVARFFGIDVEKRNPDWMKQQIGNRILKKVRNKEDVSSMVKALNTMGFDGSKIALNAVKKVKAERQAGINKAMKESKQNPVDNVVDLFNAK